MCVWILHHQALTKVSTLKFLIKMSFTHWLIQSIDWYPCKMTRVLRYLTMINLLGYKWIVWMTRFWYKISFSVQSHQTNNIYNDLFLHQILMGKIQNFSNKLLCLLFCTWYNLQDYIRKVASWSFICLLKSVCNLYEMSFKRLSVKSLVIAFKRLSSEP